MTALLLLVPLAVHIYLFRKNKDGFDFLVELRAKTKDLKPNTWDLRFGGHLKSGKDIKTTLVDELKDEIGLDVKLTDLIEGNWRQRNKYPNNEFTKVYYLEFKGDIKDLKFNDNEVQKVKWMNIEEIQDSMQKEPDIWSGGLEGFKEILDILKEKV